MKINAHVYAQYEFHHHNRLIPHKDSQIRDPKEISFTDITNVRNSSDNLRSYAKAYLSDDGVCSSLIGVEVIQEDVITASRLIGATGGGTGVHPDAALICYGGLVVCCADTVFKLSLPNLDLAWRTAADIATCFGIYYLDDDYIVHGELSITRLDRDGKIVWQREGRDIWTIPDGKDALEVHAKEAPQ